jgi:hypothetical protein
VRIGYRLAVRIRTLVSADKHQDTAEAESPAAMPTRSGAAVSRGSGEALKTGRSIRSGRNLDEHRFPVKLTGQFFR